MEKLTTRQWRLHDYIKSQGGRHLSKREIYENVDGYEWHENNSDKCPTIREDMKAINESSECDAIIVFAKQEYWWANKEETIAYRNRKMRSFARIIQEVSALDRKLGLDGQGKLLNNAGHELKPENEEVHETCRKDA